MRMSVDAHGLLSIDMVQDPAEVASGCLGVANFDSIVGSSHMINAGPYHDELPTTADTWETAGRIERRNNIDRV